MARVPLPRHPSGGTGLSPRSRLGDRAHTRVSSEKTQDLAQEQPGSFPPGLFSCLLATAAGNQRARTAPSSAAAMRSRASGSHRGRGERRIVISYKHHLHRASAKSLNFNPIPHKISFEYLRAKPVLRSYLVLYPPSFPLTAFR